MAATPKYKIYSAANEYVAACKHAEDAAAVVALYNGGTIRVGHKTADIAFKQIEQEPLSCPFVDNPLRSWNRCLTDRGVGDAAESYDAVASQVYGFERARAARMSQGGAA